MTLTVSLTAFAYVVLCLPAGFGQPCSASLNNAIGDTIAGTVELDTSDQTTPEYTEGETLQVSSSGGELSMSIATYRLQFPYSFMARVDNEVVTGVLVGDDGDETCSISAAVNAHHIFTPPQKQYVNAQTLNFALQAVGVGGVAGVAALASLCATPISAAICIGITTYGVGAGAAAAIMAFISGSDPPDPNFMVIATPNIPNIQPLVAGGSLTQAEATAFNAVFANQASIIGIGLATYTSINRAHGALLAGNSYWEAQQTQAAQLYASELGLLLSNQAALLKTLNGALSAAGVSITFSAADVLKFQQQVGTQGLPASWLQMLNSWGVPSDLISQLTNLVIFSNKNAAGTNFPGILISPNFISGLQGATSAFSPLLVPPGQCVPLPFVLQAPAGSLGTLVSFSSSETSTAFIDAAAVLVPPGATTDRRTPNVCGVNFGTATITENAGGQTTSIAALVTAMLAFVPANMTVPLGQQGRPTLALAAAAPTDLTINLSSDSPSVAIVPNTIAIPAGSWSVTVPVMPVSAGTTTIRASELPNLAAAILSVTVH